MKKSFTLFSISFQLSLMFLTSCSLISGETVHLTKQMASKEIITAEELAFGTIVVGKEKELELTVEFKLSGPSQFSASFEREGTFRFVGGVFPGTGGTCPSLIERNIHSCVLRLSALPLGSGSHTSQLILQTQKVNPSKTEVATTFPVSLKATAEYLSPIDLSTGLIARFQFDDNTLTTDSAPTDPHSAIAVGNVQPVPEGRVDQSIQVGQAGHLTLADDASLNRSSIPQRTVSFWFSANDLSLARPQVIYAEGDAASGITVYLQDGLLRAGTWSKQGPSTNQGNYIASEPVLANHWYHVAIRLEETLSLFLNATLVGTTPSLPLVPRAPIRLGRGTEVSRFHSGPYKSCDEGCETNFEGLIDEARIYNRSLDEKELRQLAHVEFYKELCFPNPAPSGSSISVHDPRFHVVGDGITDDTSAIQAAIHYAYTKHIEQLVFEKRSYLLTSVSVPPGLRLRGNCATVKMKALSGGFNRMFLSPGGYGWTKTVDAPPTYFQDFIFDGQRALQDHSINLEHQGGIFVTAETSPGGHVIVYAHDNYFENMAGDAMFGFNHATVIAKRNQINSTKRCSIGVSGTDTTLVVDDMISRSGGGHLDVEPNNDSSSNIHLYIRYSEFDRADLGLTSSLSSILIQHSRITRKLWVLNDPTSTVTFEDSEIFQGTEDGYSMVRAPGKETRFTRTRFIAKLPERSPGTGVSYFSPLHVGWRNGVNQRLIVENSRFEVEGTVLANDVIRAVYLEIGRASDGNQVMINDSFISSDFQTGVELRFGGAVRVNHSRIEARNVGLKLRYRDTPDYPDYFYDVEVSATEILSTVEASPGVQYTTPENRLVILP